MTQHSSNSNPLMADPSLLKIVSELLPTSLERHVPIAREAERKRARLSSISFYAVNAAKEDNNYWIRMAISYRGED